MHDEIAQRIGKKQPFKSLKQRAFVNICHWAHLLEAVADQLLANYGLTSFQFNVLRILRGEGRPMNMSQIRARLIWRASDLTRLIDRLVEAELVERQALPKNRRVVQVSLTTKGSELLAQIDEPLRLCHESQFPNFTERELRTLNELAEKGWVMLEKRPPL